VPGEAILVTGGAGYIGSHVCKALFHAGYLPVSLDNLSTGHREAVKWGPLLVADISDVSAVNQAFADHPIRGVIHLAAKAYVGESVLFPELYFDNNVRQLLDFLDHIRPFEVQGVVFSSSCSVYGTPTSLPVTEQAPLDPLSPYAQTKVFGEWAIKAYSGAGGPNYALLRYFNAAGADPEGELGEGHNPETHLIPNAISAALDGSALTVFGTDYATPDGTCVRDYVHVADLADAHVRALRRCQEGHCLTVNLGTGNGHSVLEVAKAVEATSGKPVNLILERRRAGDAEALYASNRLARELLGWDPRYPQLSEMVEHAYHWFAREAAPSA